MNELSNFLVESILGESVEMDKVIVVYSGRFQPFHKGHYATYEHLTKKFGKDNVYIATSNVTDNKKSPFNFQEKKTIMTKMFGILSNKIVQIKNPYAPTEILSKYDAAKTGFITVVGEKDEARLGGKFFTPYKGKVELGYLDKGYVYAAPAQPNAISGTDVRKWLASGSEEEKKAGFLKAYPKFDPTVFKFITLKLSKLSEDINLDVNVGDTLLMGKFKNKKVKVNDIGKDEYGMPTINGKKATTFRIPEDNIEEMGLPGGAGVGLSLSGGYINGAPNPKDVKKMKSKLDKDGSDEYQTVDEDTILEYTGNGAFYNDGNATTGKMWNGDWDDYDDQNYYLDNLEGWEFFFEKPSEVEKERAVDQKLPTDDQTDGKTHKYNRILRQDLPMPYELVEDVKTEMAKADLDKVEKYADSQLSPEDVILGKETDHFFQRLNDPRNGKEISPAELTGFFKRLGRNKKKFLDFVKQYKEFVVKDKRTNINIPFMVQTNKLIAKTIMRKDDFKSSTPVYTTESLNEVKWEDSTYDKCMLGKLPLSLNIVKKLVDPIRVVSLHATDVENLPKVAALQGTKKSISTFTQTTKWGKLVQGKGMHTKGGIIVALSGTVLAQSIMDLWTEPDKQGRRWVNPGTVIADLGRETDVVFNFAPELKKYKEEWMKNMYDKPATNQEKAEFIKKYYDAAEKYMLSKKKEFQDKYLNSNGLYYDSDWNEVVLTQIKIEGILVVPSLLKVKTQIGSWTFDREDKNETEKIIKQLKQKYPNIVVADTESDIQNFIKKNGGTIKESVNNNKDLLIEGGAYGHMHHPFDIEMNLTFGDLKNIVKNALNGNLDVAREKTDGQALAVSWVNGRLVAARNKSHLKNKGEGAMTIGQVAEKFANRGGLTDAYNFAMNDLSKAVAALSEPQRKKIFNDGSSFMNLEVIYPTSVNVIPYGQPLLVFHGTFDYDLDGNIVGENQQSARILAGMIKQVNQHVQSKYTIQGPPMQKLPKSEKLAGLQSKYMSMISKLQSEFKLSDNDGVADYHQAWWKNYIFKNAKGLDPIEVEGLVRRWAFGEKAFRIATIGDEKLRAWAEKVDKQDQQKIAKDNLLKFETIFLGVGAEVLSFMESVLTANPKEATKQMVARLHKTVEDVKKLADPKKLDKLKLELSRLQALGGFDKIVPNEGIVFVYKGNTYKLTGAFAPLNQILGLFYE